MEEKKETVVPNIEEGFVSEVGEAKPAAENVVDEDIQYTFVVPKGEIYRDPDLEPSEISVAGPSETGAAEPSDTDEPEFEGAVPEPVIIEPEPAEVTGKEPEPGDAEADSVESAEPESAEADDEESEPAKTIVMDRRRFTEKVNDALADAAEADEEDFVESEDDFFDTYKAADPEGRPTLVEPPVYAATGLPDEDDFITYTFVVPKGEVYTEPDPEEERAEREAERFKQAVLSEETKVMERQHADGEDAEKTQYGLPADHAEMGELAKKQKARRLYKKRKKNRFITRFYVFLTILFFGIAWFLISNSGLFTIDAIVVQGNSHYTAEEIINMGHASPGRNIIYKANIKETKEFLENNPYIKHAEVRCRLPSTLVIRVTEREERLAFKYDDDYLVMDEDGILLKKSRNKPMTTIVQGIVVSKIKLGEKIGTDNGIRMNKVLDLIKMMMKSDLYFVSVDITSEKKVKAYVYDTLVVKTDYDTLMTNMENGRLHLVLEKLFGDGIERGTITFGEDGTASFIPTF